jgi:hypothetical protein
VKEHFFWHAQQNELQAESAKVTRHIDALRADRAQLLTAIESASCLELNSIPLRELHRDSLRRGLVQPCRDSFRELHPYAIIAAELPFIAGHAEVSTSSGTLYTASFQSGLGVAEAVHSLLCMLCVCCCWWCCFFFFFFFFCFFACLFFLSDPPSLS